MVVCPLLLAPDVALVAYLGGPRIGALGYGLKYSSAFGHTHLGRIGRPEAGSISG